MFRISDFSRFTRVSIKTLRHYDAVGLLKPARVDEQTRYRYYEARQIPRLQRILALRDLGFGLRAIRGLLDGGGPRLKRMLEARQRELAGQIDADRARLTQIEMRLHTLADSALPAFPDAVLREIAPIRVATRRARVANLDLAVQRLFETVEADVAGAGVRAAGPPILLYYDRDHREVHAEVAVAIPVTAAARNAGKSRIVELPALRLAACVAYSGGYDEWALRARGLLHWLETRDLAPAGPMREVFLQFKAQAPLGRRLPPQFLVEEAKHFLTEMQIPVRPRGSRDR